MKSLGFIFGLLIAIVIWIVTFFVGATLVDKVPREHREIGAAAGLVLLGAGAVGGRRAWNDIIARFEAHGRRMRRDRLQRAAEKMRLIRAESQIRADERWMQTNLQRRLENSRALAVGLAAVLREAERSLSEAENALIDQRTSTFWDLVESALVGLATFTTHLELLIGNAQQYESDAAGLKSEPAPFLLDLAKLPESACSEEKLADLVRRALGRPEFAQIYELRRRDAISVGNFGAFGNALTTLKDRLTRAVSEMARILSAAH